MSRDDPILQARRTLLHMLNDAEIEAARKHDPYLVACIRWMQKNSHRKHYFLGKSMAAQKAVSRLASHAEVMSLEGGATGWRDFSEKTSLCCSAELDTSTYHQVSMRLSSDDSQLLLFRA